MASDNDFKTGPIRGAVGAEYDFLGLPLIGLLALGRTAKEGADKYGRFNYLLGFPVHDLVNRAMRHIILWGMGDTSEPHLAHATWGLMAAMQGQILNPEQNLASLPGPGYTLTADIMDELERNRQLLALRRSADSNEYRWTFEELADFQRVIRDRIEMQKIQEDHAIQEPDEDLGDLSQSA